MKSVQEIALTPALSPEEREKLSSTGRDSLISDSFPARPKAVPSPGGEGKGEGEPISIDAAKRSAPAL